MKFIETPLEGTYLIELETHDDDRGFFARVFCVREFEQMGLASQFVQVNNSLSGPRGTLRGMHYQLSPHAETKILRCIQGAFWDVILDLRPGSSSFGRWFGAELSAENRRMMYVPKGCAHGFITLTENSEAFYLVDEFYSPEYERGVRWNDPRFNIDWPIEPTVISEKDRQHRLFDPQWHLNSALQSSAAATSAS